MIIVLRIRGLVGINKDAEETFSRLNLRRKFSCILIRENPETLGMLKKVYNFIAYGKINKETLLELIKKRGKPIKGKIDAEKIVSELEGKSEKSLEELGIKRVFNLHPPIKGFKSTKLHYPKGDLGKNEKINELIRRML